MKFTSEIFLFYFFPLVIAFYYLFKKISVRTAISFLTIASLVFYGWETPKNILIVLFVVVVVWLTTDLMNRLKAETSRFLMLIFSLVVALTVLVFFKYSAFVAQNLSAATHWLGFDIVPTRLREFCSGIVLPIGISFYTFNMMSYAIDLYTRRIQRANGFIEFICYTVMFPHLVAGPIIRYSDISDNMKNPRLTWDTVQEGLVFFILGLSKKVLIADSMAPLANYVFDQSITLTGLMTILGVIAFALQVYFDFSGYSEMAVGLALLLGFRFPQNFNSPYKSKSIIEFWTRWHMSLSFWFRDYLYYPLAMHYLRKGNNPVNRYKPHLYTMTLVGLWHGAGWNFILFGLGHGIGLVFDDLFFSKKKDKLMIILRQFWCAFVVLFLFILFRAKDFETSGRIMSDITTRFFHFNFLHDLRLMPRDAQLAFLLIVPVVSVTLFAKNVYEIKRVLSPLRSLVYSVLFITCVYSLLARDYIPFIYFQF